MPGPEPMTYAAAGVDLDAADRSVELIGDAVRRTLRAEVLGSIGGFGGLFELDVTRYRHPVLVSGTDGVGTKVDYARRLERLDTIGIDLVAMVVDDLVVSGAEPLFFNDYISVGRLDPDRVAAIVGGIADGCALAGCALVGGETAEHPGLLADDEFDLAGFGVAVVERDDILGPDRVRSGDLLIGMASSGLHSNGYSLVRRIVGDRDLYATHGLSRPLGDELLTPTRIYAAHCLALCAAVEVHALCHVTGGGLPGNLPRILPDGLSVHVDTATWQWPEIFDWLRTQGPVVDTEMWRAFNCGVGMVAVVPPDVADAAVAVLADHGVDAWILGGVVQSAPDTPRVQLAGA
ncbi:MAG TPA: phosphoribosylformylglycinamidine cyclo-ligase [Egicoccus sp.]|nr:phosphoribosylformylglycinamidine cyclo-ligase [Egicoccus sp.]HSK22809.1 phosphoribosylformylglycinamidine cyclo-ligase [Egicoccus sp.]